jgi:hypothetical protein
MAQDAPVALGGERSLAAVPGVAVERGDAAVGEIGEVLLDWKQLRTFVKHIKSSFSFAAGKAENMGSSPKRTE